MQSYLGSFQDECNETNRQAVHFFIACDPNRYNLLEETLGFQSDVAGKLRQVKGGRGPDNLALCCGRCMFNTAHLYGAYEILRSGDYPMFLAMVGVVFESFPKLFYCMRHAGEAKLAFRREEFLYLKRVKRRDGAVERFCKSAGAPADREKFRFVKPRWFREKVYTEDRRKEIAGEYGPYTANVHPGFEPAHVRTGGGLERGWNAGLDRLIILSLMNAFVMVNAAKRDLTGRGDYDGSRRFVERSMREAGGDLGRGVALIYPNVREYTETLPFALPNGSAG